MDVAGIITAVGGAIALILKVTGGPKRKRKAADVAGRLETLEARLDSAESKLLGWAAWAHDARVTAAANGVRLPMIPGRLLGNDDATIPAPRPAGETTDRTDA